MTSWYRELAESEGAGYDPLCVERSAPIDDDEAAAIEALCHTATPGPLVLDDATDGDGAPMVTLPDGRVVISRTAAVESLADPAVISANAELICKARYYLLRLLRDRQQWQSERQELLDRIAELEAKPAKRARRSAPKQPR
ncbi:MAG: hypothetical protein RBS80_16185 [Thermoguttaceae bacterium]|jgi:hypothetical protein|nr:hypothetical protein [Thermoguttaceae bacterium]